MSRHTDESFYDKVCRKTQEDPLVPIGALVTTYFLLQGFKAFAGGQVQRAQYMMRGRVVAQGFTVIAMAGAAFLNIKPHDRPASMEEKMGKMAK